MRRGVEGGGDLVAPAPDHLAPAHDDAAEGAAAPRAQAVLGELDRFAHVLFVVHWGRGLGRVPAEHEVGTVQRR